MTGLVSTIILNKHMFGRTVKVVTVTFKVTVTVTVTVIVTVIVTVTVVDSG